MPEFKFHKDVTGRYWVTRDDTGTEVYIVNPTTDRTTILPSLQRQFGQEVVPATIVNALDSLDGLSTSVAVSVADGDVIPGTRTDTGDSDPNSI